MDQAPTIPRGALGLAVGLQGVADLGHVVNCNEDNLLSKIFAPTRP
jgi:hypothetical protein